MIDAYLRVSGTVNDSIVDGPGLRFTIFVQGCLLNCPGCHNQHTHDLYGGYDALVSDLMRQALKNPLIDGITISGGEPFLQSKSCSLLAKMAKENGLSVWAYTGYTIDWLMDFNHNTALDFLKYIDVLVDGRYIEGQKSYEARFRGSKNQRLIDVPKTLLHGRVIEWEQKQ